MLGFGSPRKNDDDASDQKIEIQDIDHLDIEMDRSSENLEAQPFTSELNPQEIYLLAKCGLEPYQVVVGSIVYSMGLRGVVRTLMRAFTRGEMVDFSHLQRVARDLAISRMRSRSSDIGAAGVVGVHVNAIHHADFIEVVAMGTAVRPIGTGIKPPATGDNEVVVSA